MKKLYRNLLIACAFGVAAQSAQAIGWPANYQGVMLQGFYWDSYTDTKWTNLEANADEYSQYFSLIWVPNSGKCGSSNNMGYMPQYWFTNHNSSFGTQAQLTSMINTYKEKGVGIIADVVINHRNGVTNWHDFPKEQWNGQTWSIGLEGICSNDEMAYASGQPKPTGAPDTGDNFDGCRDLDHTNANVQNNCKNYCKFLLDELGYAGFRYDMVKGYGGQYTKIYNQYSKPTFSVGEYWDSNYDAVKGWIEATVKESAAFDFPFKYAVNEAFHSNDLTKLVWKANGTTDQPAGMIHFGYPQLAVTFIDNHDTYRDGSKFNGNVVAANAFMLCSPGTPCVFLPHYQANKAAIQTLINIRNAVGVHNMSAVKVLKSTTNCYMAEVTGTKGKLVVKIGSDMSSPAGYTNADIKASGNDYCVWTTAKVEGGGSGSDTPVGESFMVYFNNSTARWTTPHIHYWGGEESTWPGVAMTFVKDNVWSYKVPAGTTGILFNAGDGDATKTSDFTAVANHIYSTTGDQGEYGGGSQGGGDDVVVAPSKLYILGNLSVGSWTTDKGVEMTRMGNVYKASNVEIVAAAVGETNGFFTFVTTLGEDWDEVNGGNRFGAAVKDELLTPNAEVSMMSFPANVSASSAYSWQIPAGKYDITADFASMKMVAMEAGYSSVEAIETEDSATAVYYNLQGVRVDNPSNGLYIKVTGKKVEKVFVR